MLDSQTHESSGWKLTVFKIPAWMPLFCLCLPVEALWIVLFFFAFLFFFYKFLRSTPLSSLSPLGGKVSWSSGDFQFRTKAQVTQPRRRILQAGRKIIVKFSPHVTMCTFPQVYMSGSGAKGISNRAAIVGFLGLISIFILAFGTVVLICLCFIRFLLCHTTMS